MQDPPRMILEARSYLFDMSTCEQQDYVQQLVPKSIGKARNKLTASPPSELGLGRVVRALDFLAHVLSWGKGGL
jgi:hypothetical protein